MRLLLLTVLLSVALYGCDNVSTEDDPAGVANLCANVFEECISPLLQNPTMGNQSCASSTCHGLSGGSGGGFKLNENPLNGSPEMTLNLNSAQAFVNPSNANQSKLLAEPLVGDSGIPTVGPHGGGDIFNSTADPCYLEILAWAQANNSACPSSPVNCGNGFAEPPAPADIALRCGI